MADLKIPARDVLSSYNDRIGDLSAVHLVADLVTASKFLNCVQCLGEIHLLLSRQRPFRPDGRYEREELVGWGRQCSAALAGVTRPMMLAVEAMRVELDLPVDADEYEKLIRAALGTTLAGIEQLFSDLLAG